MISTPCKYAIRSCIYLSLNEHCCNKIGVKQISENLKIPAPILSKVINILVKHKLLFSTKGPNGGVCLARPASEISLLDIIAAMDGMDFFESCLIGSPMCTKNELHCPVHDKYYPIREQLKNLFSSINIKELSEEIKNGKRAI